RLLRYDVLREGIDPVAGHSGGTAPRLPPPLSPPRKLEIYFAAEKQTPPRLGTVNRFVPEHFPKRTVRELAYWRGSVREAQQTFGRHHDQRLEHTLHGLPSEQVKILRRRRRVRDLYVSSGRELQEPLQPRARMLGSHTFVTVGKQQRQFALLVPLFFSGGDELVHDHLRGVDEVAELSFPQHQRFLSRYAVTVLKAQHAGFRQRAV